MIVINRVSRRLLGLSSFAIWLNVPNFLAEPGRLGTIKVHSSVGADIIYAITAGH